MSNALLWLAARPRMEAALVPALDRAARAVSDWPATLADAERHGLGPLLYRHLRGAGLAVPAPAARQLQGLYLRHRAAHGARVLALTEILETLDARGIEVWLLKGSALAALPAVYSDPALRPASDIDLLVRRDNAVDAWHALERLGFRALTAAAPLHLARHRHLPVLARSADGLLVQVELHHDALSGDAHAVIEVDEHREAPTLVDVSGRSVPALGLHEMLWHLCEHLVGTRPSPVRLIWVADIIGYADAFAGRLQWEALRRRHSIVGQVLEFLSRVIPMPEDLARQLPGGPVPAPIGHVDVLGAWPTSTGSGTRWSQLRRTLCPPAWWLDLRYGRRPTIAAELAVRLRHAAVLSRTVRRRARAAIESRVQPEGGMV